MRRDVLRAAVREWYRPRRRAYAWRRGRRSPYRTLVSEVMLQQTQAARVEPIFESFVERFPDVRALASASRADVLRAWAGLGHNRRAVALHEAARVVVGEHGGRVPSDLDALRRLPGVGPYTAAAVASIGFGVPVAAMDTNVRRVCARLLHGAEPDEIARSRLDRDTQSLVDPAEAGEWNQALMDLGRTACRPRPRCDVCPLARACRFRASRRKGRSSNRPAPPWEGSSRQIRGAVVRELRGRRSSADAAIVALVGGDPTRVGSAIDGLLRDGVVERTRAGRLRLPVR